MPWTLRKNPISAACTWWYYFSHYPIFMTTGKDRTKTNWKTDSFAVFDNSRFVKQRFSNKRNLSYENTLIKSDEVPEQPKHTYFRRCECMQMWEHVFKVVFEIHKVVLQKAVIKQFLFYTVAGLFSTLWLTTSRLFANPQAICPIQLPFSRQLNSDGWWMKVRRSFPALHSLCHNAGV